VLISDLTGVYTFVTFARESTLPSEKLKLANQSLIWCSSAPGPMP
jgi:hypothetical protein